jgi:hypothetical protein
MLRPYEFFVEEDQEKEESHKRSQILGCVFAVLAIGFIFLVIFAFMRSC